MTELESLRNSLAIDINLLHENAQEQPDLADRAGQLVAEAKSEAKKAKMRLEIAEATTEKDVRLQPETYGLTKVTESAIKSAVILHPDVISAKEELIENEKEAAMADAVYDAFQHRKSMLGIEAKLYIANYFGDVYEDGDTKKVRQQGNADEVSNLRSQKRKEE